MYLSFQTFRRLLIDLNPASLKPVSFYKTIRESKTGFKKRLYTAKILSGETCMFDSCWKTEGVRPVRIEQFSIESRKQFRVCFAFAPLSNEPESQPMRSKPQTNRASLARVFPRLAPVACICFEF